MKKTFAVTLTMILLITLFLNVVNAQSRMKHYYQNGQTWSSKIMQTCGSRITAGSGLKS